MYYTTEVYHVSNAAGAMILKPLQLFYIIFHSLIFLPFKFNQMQNDPHLPLKSSHMHTFPHFPSHFPRKRKHVKWWEDLVSLDPEILSCESLTELPVCWDYVRWRGSATVAACHPERKWLTDQNCVRLPILSPVPAQTHPPSVRSLHASLHYIPGTSDIGDQNQVEVTEAVDCKSDPSLLTARNPDLKKKIINKIIKHILKNCREGLLGI